MPQQTARPPAIIMPDESDFGPAMRACSPGQRAFICAMVQSPIDPTAAAGLAGLGGTPGSRTVTASRLMRTQKVITALREEADRRFQSGALLGVHVIMEIARTTGHKDQLKAAERLVEQNGFVIAQIQKIQHEHKHIVTLADLQQSIRDDLKKFNLPVPEIVDAQFEEVEPEEETNGSEEDDLSDILA